MTSVFTRIVRGEIPAFKLYEDELTLAFLDINPAARGHTLVIAKPELPGLLDLPPELVTATALTTQRVARAIVAALKPDGFNIIQNNGSAAGQVVFHFHIHIIPRWEGDRSVKLWRPGTATADDLRAVADEIIAHL
ncbi:HIT family protein [Chloroflexus aggregans]|uniref:Histidine triad (HIT) protein n=1 Tax=Chloroflexus aggregans (strain MD-66 / DSM 9485) TaxID=326427 RepID=B8G572_CHLAD|nr:HIT family protein [Chloroflexus aggregans]ACL23705.1 histidine triad (HIT) protein [Chloroflexus aggregans DSM 9485]